MIQILGIPVNILHALVVELHTGIAVFAFLALLAMLITDLIVWKKPASERVQIIRRDTDAIAYFGALGAVFFLILSGITGYLIEPYSTMISDPLLLNKSLTALGALYFWAMFAFIRFWCGPGMWRKTGLYALNFIAAVIALLFTTFAGSMGAELSPYGQSALNFVYNALGLNFRSITLTQNDVYITAAVTIVFIAIIGLLSLMNRNPTTKGKVAAVTKH